MEAYLEVGELAIKESISKTDLAAYTMLANVIYNLDESLSRS